jgi:glycosyltransferase involved in cell wall biosynthesis
LISKSKSDGPKISVLMTVFNGMPYLVDAVESIFSQTFTDFQFVIVNDGSDDETNSYLSSITDPRVEILHQENKGTAAAANYGLSLCNGEFIARMDADDWALPQRLELQLEFMESHPDVGIVGSQVAPLGKCGVGSSLNLPCDHDKIFGSMMEGLHGMAHSSIMMRGSLIRQLGGYWPYRLIDDWDMMLRMGEVSALANIDKVLLHYRVHAGSLNGSSMRRMHLHISFAIDRAKRRQAGEPMLEFERFVEIREQRPVWQKLAESAHIHALAQYRLAVAELQSEQKLKGYPRLVWAAVCSPSRTVHRLGRIVRRKISSKSDKSRAAMNVDAPISR